MTAPPTKSAFLSPKKNLFVTKMRPVFKLLIAVASVALLVVLVMQMMKRSTPGVTSLPVAMPTLRPTMAVTRGPTGAPTLRPTMAATQGPTGAPTLRPTMAATQGPTGAPTARPTSVPDIQGYSDDADFGGIM
jgi:hypothetical protein